MSDIIKQAVDAFLAWKLPADFLPDGAINFHDRGRTPADPSWPTGTNLLTAIQAKAMFEATVGPHIAAMQAESERLACEVQRLREENRELLLDMAELHPMDDCAQETHSLQAQVRDLEWQIWRPLKEGEMTQDGDQSLGPDEDDEWGPINECHRRAPDPRFQAHMKYRRRIVDELKSRLEEAERKTEDAHGVLRSLASWLGNGGYNAPEVDPAQFEAKIRDGVDHLLKNHHVFCPHCRPCRNEGAKADRDHHKADASRLAEALERLIPGDDDQCAADKPFAIEVLRLHREGGK